eukprot:UN34555
MSEDDAQSLNRLCMTTKTLGELIVQESGVTDDLMYIIMKGLESNQTITHINFSYNTLGDRAASKVGCWLGRESNVVSHLYLAQNEIGFTGLKDIARGLKSNTTVLELDLRLNNIGDEGGAILLRTIANNNNIKKLNISGNNFGVLTANALIDFVAKNNCLTHLDISNNDLSKMNDPETEEKIAIDE